VNFHTTAIMPVLHVLASHPLRDMVPLTCHAMEPVKEIFGNALSHLGVKSVAVTGDPQNECCYAFFCKFGKAHIVNLVKMLIMCSLWFGT